VDIDATILTKVDADVKGGSALSVTYVTKKPILFIGTGQKYDDLEAFSPERFVQLILK
jgi:fused signal recognition particle receptor